MSTIYPIPYQKIQPRNDGHLIIEIRKQEFDGIHKQEGKIEIFIENSYFNKVTVINQEEIDYKDISLSFFGCFIEELNVEHIVTKKHSYFCVWFDPFR